MKKVFYFMKGKKDEKREVGLSAASPFTEEILCRPERNVQDETHVVEPSWCYEVDLTGKDKTITKLHKAAWQGNLEKLKVNIRKSDIDSVDRLNRTSLHLSAARGHANVVWFLLNAKAKINICDNQGKTPFLKAIECGHKEVIHMMLERGVDLNTIDYSGNSGLHIAAKQGFYEIASILLKQGANFESSNNLGESPLHIATKEQHRDLVELLLRYGSSVNAVDRDNRSPLMFAAKCGNMALVQLFLEYGAQRKVQDSNDWTAEDYAILSGHHDVAAELKSPSEILSLDFGTKSLEVTETGQMPLKRSVSDTSLHSEKNEEKGNRKTDGVDSDTWNDSQLSEIGQKPQTSGLTLTKFLPPSSDEESSNESESSNKDCGLKDDDMQDSPHSCVIPPPCKPPRSWDLIQSGVIDDLNKSSEPRRRSLLTLGSLRTKRESFTESPSDIDSPGQQGGSPRVGQGDADQKINKSNFSQCTDKDVSPSHQNKLAKSDTGDTCMEKGGRGIKLKENVSIESSVYKNRSLKESSESDWDSEDSLPLETFHVKEYAPPVPPLPKEILGSEPSSEVKDINDSASEGASCERRGRFLLRATPIDLTDDDGDLSREKERNFLLMPRNSNSKHSDELLRSQGSSVAGTLGRDGTLLGYEEIWETNSKLPSSHSSGHLLSSASDGSSSIKVEHGNDLSLKNISSTNTSFLDTWGGLMPQGAKRVTGDNLIFPSPCLEQKPKQLSLGTFEMGEAKSSKYKLESHSLDELGNGDQPHTRLQSRKHSRQQSVSVLNWGKTEEVYTKQTSTNLERMIADSKRINKQLECYDEALRELAQVSLVKKQNSLPLPPRSISVDSSMSHYVGGKGQRYLSLPRTNVLIDEAFKEIGRSSIIMKRTSLSLPRTMTPQDMESEGSSYSLTKKLRPFSGRRRAESEGETFPSRCKDHINRSLSYDTKFHGSNKNTDLPLPKTPAFIGKSPAGMTKSEEKSEVFNTDKCVDKKIRKKRKILLAMRCFRKHHHDSLNGSPPPGASEEESHEDPPFWLSTDKTGPLERQSTVIEKKDFCINSKIESMSPTFLPEQEESVIAEEKKELQMMEDDDSEMKHVIVEFHEGTSNIVVKEEKVTGQDQEMKQKYGTNKEVIKGQVKVAIDLSENIEEKGRDLDRKTETVQDQYTLHSVGREIILQDDASPGSQQEEISENMCLENDTVPGKVRADGFSESAWESTDHLQPTLLIKERIADSMGGSVPTSCPSSASVDIQDDHRGLELHRDSQSEGESGGSHNDVTPQHNLLTKSHHSLLKEHLRTATAERGRLQETAAQLGEQAEKLKYELAEAREATRSREEVINLLQDQLLQMENKYSQVLEETHHYRLRLGNVEQELHHLHDVCQKYEEEKLQLTEIICQKDQELTVLAQNLKLKDDESKLTTAVNEREKEKPQHELLLHVMYLEQQNSKTTEEINKLEKKNEELQKQVEELATRNLTLSEENARISSQSSNEMRHLEEDSVGWKDLFESGVRKLSEQLAQPWHTVATAAASAAVEDDLLSTVEHYKDELKKIIIKFENMQDKVECTFQQDSVKSQPEFREEIQDTIDILKRGYSQVESALVHHSQKVKSLQVRLISLKSSENGEDCCIIPEHQETGVSKQHQEGNEVFCKQREDLHQSKMALADMKCAIINVHNENEILRAQVESLLEKIQLSNTTCDIKCTRFPHRRFSEQSGIVSSQSHALLFIERLLKENKELKVKIKENQNANNISVVSSAPDVHPSMTSLVEENTFMKDDMSAVTKLYEDAISEIKELKNQNENLKLDLSSLQHKQDTTCSALEVVAKKQKVNVMTSRNGSLEHEMISSILLKDSKYTQTTDDKIDDIMHENNITKLELKTVKTQLSHLESELQNILLKNNEGGTAVAEVKIPVQGCSSVTEKTGPESSEAALALKRFSSIFDHLYQENRTLKAQLCSAAMIKHCSATQMCSEEMAKDSYCTGNSENKYSLNEDACHSVMQCENADNEKNTDDQNCVSPSGCNVVQQSQPRKTKCCRSISEPAHTDAIMNDEKETHQQYLERDADDEVISINLHCFIDPSNRETEFTCKNTAAHPKVYGLKNERRYSEGSGCWTCHDSTRIVGEMNEKPLGNTSLSKDYDKKSRKIHDKDVHMIAWSYSGDQEYEPDKCQKLVSERNYPSDTLDVVNIATNLQDFQPDEGYLLVDGILQEKITKEHFQEENKEKASLHSNDRSPKKPLSQLTDISNFPLTFGLSGQRYNESGEPTGMCSKPGTWPSRDAATNTAANVPSADFQKELQQERERSRRNQQSMKKLKAEVQLLRNKLGDTKKGGKMEANLAKQNTCSSTSNSCCSTTSSKHLMVTSAPVSPLHFDQTLAEFQQKVCDLEQKLREENSMRWALELQVNKMKFELQEKFQLEKDLDALRRQMEKEFVSRYELEQLKRTYEMALQRAKQEATTVVRDDVSSRLHHLNCAVEKQMQEQSRYEQLRSSGEAQMRQDFQDTRLKLLSELARVQAALQEKGEKEMELRQKCEKLSRECDRKHELRRKKLIEKSYSISLAPYSNSCKEKEASLKSGAFHHTPIQSRSPAKISSAVPTNIPDVWPASMPFNHLLRRELEKSIRKHSSADAGGSLPSASTSRVSSDERLKILKNKYCLH